MINLNLLVLALVSLSFLPAAQRHGHKEGGMPGGFLGHLEKTSAVHTARYESR